jgi:glycosyltransferase involved in cell wall biosynthesis
MIAINAAMLDSRPSGLGTVARELADAVARLEDRTAVFGSSAEAFAAAEVHAVPHWVCERHAFPLGGFLRFLWTQTVLPLRLKRLGAGVLLSPSHEAVFFPPCPQVVVIHDLLPLLFPDSFPRQESYYRHALPWALRKAAAVVAVSENTRQDLIRHYGLPPEKVVVIYSGVDPGRFHPPPAALPPAAPYILYVGNQYPYKNIARLLEAFAGLMQEGFPHSLLLAGGNDPRHFPELERLVKKSGLDGRVRFLGYVRQEELPGLYAQAQLFVLPSLYEGFGLPVLEAMACGTPVALGRTASLPEAGGDAAAYFDPLDPADMRKAMARVLGDAGLRRRMAEAGAEQARRFRWEGAAERYLELLRRVRRP